MYLYWWAVFHKFDKNFETAFNFLTVLWLYLFLIIDIKLNWLNIHFYWL